MGGVGKKRRWTPAVAGVAIERFRDKTNPRRLVKLPSVASGFPRPSGNDGPRARFCNARVAEIWAKPQKHRKKSLFCEFSHRFNRLSSLSSLSDSAVLQSQGAGVTDAWRATPVTLLPLNQYPKEIAGSDITNCLTHTIHVYAIAFKAA